MHPFKKMILGLKINSESLPLFSYFYEGRYGVSDPAHPNGGSITYKDQFGDTYTINKIFIEDGCIEYLCSSPPTVVALNLCTV